MISAGGATAATRRFRFHDRRSTRMIRNTTTGPEGRALYRTLRGCGGGSGASGELDWTRFGKDDGAAARSCDVDSIIRLRHHCGAMATESIAVLGTGTMGSAFARRLLGAGVRVNVWDPSHTGAARLADAGAQVAGTPQEA